MTDHRSDGDAAAITALLQDLMQDRDAALGALFAAAYVELHGLAAAQRATALGLQAWNVLEGFEGYPYQHAQRCRRGGWRFHGLPWRQG